MGNHDSLSVVAVLPDFTFAVVAYLLLLRAPASGRHGDLFPGVAMEQQSLRRRSGCHCVYLQWRYFLVPRMAELPRGPRLDAVGGANDRACVVVGRPEHYNSGDAGWSPTPVRRARNRAANMDSYGHTLVTCPAHPARGPHRDCTPVLVRDLACSRTGRRAVAALLRFAAA